MLAKQLFMSTFFVALLFLGNEGHMGLLKRLSELNFSFFGEKYLFSKDRCVPDI